MRFAFPRQASDINRPWSSLGSTLAWTKYQCLVIEHLRTLTSVFWLAAFVYYLKVSIRLEDGPVLYTAYAVLAIACLLTIPYLWIASRCLIGTKGSRIGPLAMLWSGHNRWRKDWIEQVAEPNERLAELVKTISADLQRAETTAKEQRLRGDELTFVTDQQRGLLSQLFDAIPSQWRRASMFVGKPHDDRTQAFASDDVQRDVRLCLANIILQVFSAFDNVVAYRTGPASLVLLFDRRGGKCETKVRAAIDLDKLGGSYQWCFEIFSAYFFLPGFINSNEGLIPAKGDLDNVHYELVGWAWTAPLRVGFLALLNPLNIFRVFNVITQGLGYRMERTGRVSSIPYFQNNYLGSGDFTDLCLINQMRFAAMNQGNHYQGNLITVPNERMVKETEQLTMTIQQEIQKAIRETQEAVTLSNS